MPEFIQIHPNDTVAVALGKIEKGTVFQGVTALEDIPQGHKMALKEMASNTQVMKYGFSIGHATEKPYFTTWEFAGISFSAIL